MSFTSQHSTAGQQAFRAGSFSCLTSCSASAINWWPASICPDPVGSRGRQCEVPGNRTWGRDGSSKLSDSMPAQIHFYMKIARKDTGLPVSDKLQDNGPVNPALFENQVFSEKPGSRQPEAPHVESLRSLLKANLTRENASPALIERIRSRMHENKG